MSAGGRSNFLAWCSGQKFEVFDNRRVLDSYCQDVLNVLREACRVLRLEFIQVGNIDVFLESIYKASACNKLLRKRFLKPDTIGPIPPGGYTGNVYYSNKAMMRLVNSEQTDGCTILQRETDAGTNHMNIPTWAWKFSATKRERCTSSLDATFILIPAYSFGTSLP